MSVTALYVRLSAPGADGIPVKKSLPNDVTYCLLFRVIIFLPAEGKKVPEL